MAFKRSEKVEQSHGLQLLRSIGAKVYVIGHPSPNDGRKFRGTGQTPGIPDVLAFLPPRRLLRDAAYQAPYGEWLPKAAPVLVFWEVKAKGGRLRPEQTEFRALCGDAYVEHVVGDLDALIAWLVKLNYVKASQFPHYRQAAGSGEGEGAAASCRPAPGLGRASSAAARSRGTAAPLSESEGG